MIHEFLKFGLYFIIWSITFSPKRFLVGVWNVYARTQGYG